MNEQVKQIAARIRELREILDIPQEEIAKKVEVSLGEYQKYEQAEDDIPIGGGAWRGPDGAFDRRSAADG